MTGIGRVLLWGTVGILLIVVVTVTLHYWPQDDGASPAGQSPKVDNKMNGRLKADEKARAKPDVAKKADGRETTNQARLLLARAVELENKGKTVASRDAYSAALEAGLSKKDATLIKAKLALLNNKILFKPRVLAGDKDSRKYRVQKNDVLSTIGGRFLIPYELIKRINGLSSDMIYAGQSLKVVNGPFEVRIYKGDYELQVWLRGRFIKAYPVGIGRGELTPVGKFLVEQKTVNPPYQPRHRPRNEWRGRNDRDNPLGERWIAFDRKRGLGIHGTIKPESIGKSVSDGCVRMLEKDVEELFDLLVVGVCRVSVYP